MDQANKGAEDARSGTLVERLSDHAFAASQTFVAPVSDVYKAWSRADLFQRWWVPKSAPGISLVSCEMEVRTGGSYRLEFGADEAETIAFYGKYLDVVENQRIVWTNDEGAEGAITTVTFEELGQSTKVTLHELYPTAEGLEEALASSALALPEQFEQLNELLGT
jgi:uncharacterized protein YndB with AHSA1/START domain